MKRRIMLLTAIVCMSTMIFTGCKNNTDNIGAAIFGTFETQTLDGSSVTQAIFADAKLTMVNIWGTFCGPCISEMPELGEISKEYADKGVQIVGIISDVYAPKDATALSIVEQTGADYTHLVLNQELYRSLPEDIQAVPTTIFVDKDGRQVGDTYVGAKDKELWLKIIDELLK